MFSILVHLPNAISQHSPKWHNNCTICEFCLAFIRFMAVCGWMCFALSQFCKMYPNILFFSNVSKNGWDIREWEYSLEYGKKANKNSMKVALTWYIICVYVCVSALYDLTMCSAAVTKCQLTNIHVATDYYNHVLIPTWHWIIRMSCQK